MSIATGTRRTFAALAGILMLGWPAGVSAQSNWPTRDVRVIVPFSAGGGTDLVTRLFAQKFTERFGKGFFVENKAGGAGGTVGSLELARAAPDGHTIGTGTTSGIQAAAIDPDVYNPLRDLQPIARFGATTLVLMIDPRIPARTLAEFTAYAAANPGLAYGSSGVGSTNHVVGEKFAVDARLSFTHIPYRGEGVALTDVVGGRVQFILVSLAAAKSHIDAGTLRPIAVTSEKRFPSYPAIPTFAESGFPGMVVEAWYGLYVPKNTPADIAEKLVRAVNDIRSDPEVRKRLMDQLVFDTSGSDDPKTFQAYMVKELERYSAIVAAAGLKK